MGDETNTNQQNGNQQEGQQNASTEIDYGKIQQMLEGTLAAKEDTALKAYFREQGLSQEEMKQAISAYKEQKAANQPDVNALQANLTAAQQEAQRAKIENQAILEASALGIDTKTIPYILKLADFSEVDGDDSETIQAAINKVLEDVPSLKPTEQKNSGFKQIGASGGDGQKNNNDELAAIFGNKKG